MARGIVAGGVAVLVAAPGVAAAQPSFPSLPPDAPSISFPVPGTAQPPDINPAPPTSGRTRPPTAPPVTLPRSVNVQLKLERDGGLTVREQVVVQAKQTMTRVAPLRVGDRVFTVRNATTRGKGSVEVTPDALTIHAAEGANEIDYTVDGAVADLGDHLEVRWQVASGWDTKLLALRASLLTPKPGRDFVCLAGPAGSTDICDSALTDASGILRVVQSNLDKGDRVDVSAELPSGLVPANARFDSTGTSAFALTPLGGAGLGLVALLLVGGFVVLWTKRSRDVGALAADVGPVELIANNDGAVTFASPDGILPGQAGMVVDERADSHDLAATVVDLAVRNYLWVTEANDDWQIVRRNPADDALTDYERAVYVALLPAGTDSVTLSVLRASPPDLAAAKSALQDDAVKRGWFVRRPNSVGRLGLIGAAVIAVGVLGTVALAVAGGPALLGIAVVIGGIGLLVGARFVPVRSKAGVALAQQVRGVAAYLGGVTAEAVPTDRELVFSRSLPFALALGETERWLAGFGPVDPAGIQWFAAQDEAVSADQERFASRIAAFLGALDGALGRSGSHGQFSAR
ncbi:DUF2207 domain-containing protein [Actinokineospora inagensis]|uniref:DUF2207 domain-containing protein n=1 Tax=Actinokineospora inagensis TaxID=103730 RepID=UPI00047B0ED3|nr:DUF2207 domain-containing protein [Actinokineospora inagensis]